MAGTGSESGGALVAGVDEAGLGPILGPLAIGWSVLRVPEPAADPWRLLRRRVTRDPRRDASRIVVADSKLVFTRNERGRRRLETTALSFLALLRADRRAPRDARELLFGALRPAVGLVERHPWYAHLRSLPREVGAELVELRAATLAREMELGGCALLDAGVRLVPSGELNASYRESGNKADTVWLKTLEVLRHLWTRWGAGAPAVTVDLLGGRVHYGPLLARGIPEASVRLVREDDHYASYELVERRAQGALGALGAQGERRRMALEFASRGEERSFPVALASCLAKYARETEMDAFNAYFGAHQPDLRPTAGYRNDGWRWLAEARTALERSAVDEATLVRER